MTTPQEVQAPASPFHGNVRPILNEVLHALDKLLGTNESTTIDLASLPFGPGELEHLEATLGKGELSAKLDALGPAAFAKRPFLACGGLNTAMHMTR